MSKQLERHLESLQEEITALAEEVQGSISMAIHALLDCDPDLACAVARGDDLIDCRENRLGEECLKVLALYQPVARDLRRVAAVLKVSTELERMAGLAVDVAERAACLAGLPPLPIPEELQRMAELTGKMVHQSLEAFLRLDTGQARGVGVLDEEVDRSNAEANRALLTLMRTLPAKIESAVSLFSAARHLERIADHAVNIAAEVVYLVEGKSLRHCPEALLTGTV